MIDTFSRKIDKLKQEYPNKIIDTTEIISIDGLKLFNRKQMQDILDISRETITEYENKGMPRSEYSEPRYILYNLKDCISWIAVNIDHSKSKMGKKSINIENEEDAALLPIRKLLAETEKLEEQAKSEKLKRQELEGTLVKKEDTDKALAELGATMGAFYRNDLKALPVILEHKSHIEIKSELSRHFKGRIEDMHKIVSENIAFKETIYDKIENLVTRLIDGKNAENIIMERKIAKAIRRFTFEDSNNKKVLFDKVNDVLYDVLYKWIKSKL